MKRAIANAREAHACSVPVIAFCDHELFLACQKEKPVSAECRNQHAKSVRFPNLQ
jgi:hypothetical protein